MHDRPAKIQRLSIEPGRRILAVSDAHANIPYLTGVLKEAGFCKKDVLILCGDFLEKGAESLKMLRLVMKLTECGNTYPLIGNCDFWHVIFEMDQEAEEYTLNYVLSKKRGLLWDMMNEAKIDPFQLESFDECKDTLYRKFQNEWKFLESLPHAIETQNFIFAHAAVYPKPLEEHTFWELIHCDAFFKLDYRYDKWVVVGHWPVVLYGDKIVSANPIIDRRRKVISIDGGCVLKDDGQLNALVIPDINSENFSNIAYDPFPEKTVLQDQAEGPDSWYIRWGDSKVKVLERGEEFSHCRHVRTGYEMDILTKYLFTDHEITECNDCTDYVLPLKKGDLVRVVEETSRGYFVKHNGISGWYFGELR